MVTVNCHLTTILPRGCCIALLLGMLLELATNPHLRATQALPTGYCLSERGYTLRWQSSERAVLQPLSPYLNMFSQLVHPGIVNPWSTNS